MSDTEQGMKMLVLATDVSFERDLLKNNAIVPVYPAGRVELRTAKVLREALANIEDAMKLIAREVADWPGGVDAVLLPDGCSMQLENLAAATMRPVGMRTVSPKMKERMVEDMEDVQMPAPPQPALKVVAGTDRKHQQKVK